MRMMLKTGEAARRRRMLLVSGVSAGIAGLLPVSLHHAPVKRIRNGAVGGIGGAKVPPTIASLADYGGRPGARRSILISAFDKAFAALDRAGGGTLFVPAGVYDFGPYADADYVILCRNLRNVAISAYGAVFTATTTANVVPSLFYFFNFHNITIAGASFIDPGFNPRFNWKGMYCVGIQADQLSSGLTLVDCYAERVTGLLASNNNAASRQFISDVNVQGEVRYSYYGVGANFIRENVNVDLVCHNVRRAFIAYALRKAKIIITSSNTSDWPGSNGLVALVSNGASTGDVENVRVRVDVSGECIHSSYVHFYHQGTEIHGSMRDIDATVNVTNADSTGSLFVFDHETDHVQSRTARVWDRIRLHGTVTAKFKGRVVANASATTSPGTVYVDRNLAQVGNMNILAAGFRVAAP